MSIVVVNWNTRELLANCLRSVEAYGEEAETIVVDNGSTDGSVEMVRERFPWARLAANKTNEGYAKANNQGIRMSGGRFVLLLNSDATLTEGALGEMAACMAADERVGVCGPRLVYPDGREQFSYGRLPRLSDEVRSVFGGGLPRYTGKGSAETEMVSGASMMVRWRMMEQVGMLDERYFMFSEEVDLCKRAIEGGWKVKYVPEATVVHVGGGSTGQTAGRVLSLYRGKLQYHEKHGGVRARRVLWTAMWLATRLKGSVYGWRGEAERAEMWREVGRGLGELKAADNG